MEDFYRGQRRRLGLLSRRATSRRAGAGTSTARTAARRGPGCARRRHGCRARTRSTRRSVATSTPWACEESGEDGPRAWPATAAEARARSTTSSPTAPRLRAVAGRDGPGERWLFHSRLSSSLNLWLLDPLEACRAVEAAYRAGGVPLHVRRGLHPAGHRLARVRLGDVLAARDAGARTTRSARDRPLPDAFWTAETDAKCLRRRPGRARDGLRAPHPAPHGPRQPRAAARRAPVGAVEWFRPPSSTAPSG